MDLKDQMSQTKSFTLKQMSACVDEDYDSYHAAHLYLKKVK